MELTNNGESQRQNGSVDFSIDDAVDAVQFGKFQKIMMVAVGLCFMSDAMEVVLLGFLSAVLKYEWDLTNSQTAAIGASVFFGELVGSAVLGKRRLK